jgi:tRNA (cytidine/uridine-2'-O-)-methyltransferase
MWMKSRRVSPAWAVSAVAALEPCSDTRVSLDIRGLGRLITGQLGTPHVARCRGNVPQVPEPSKVRLAFLQPDQPGNLGASLRLAACLDVAVEIIEPCGFPLTDKALKRAAMDYGGKAEVRRHDGWSAFLADHRRSGNRLVLLSTGGDQRLDAFSFQPGDCLLFGRESAGAPEDVHAAADARVVIPLNRDARSLNVSMAAGIVLWEALRQTGGLPTS